MEHIQNFNGLRKHYLQLILGGPGRSATLASPFELSSGFSTISSTATVSDVFQSNANLSKFPKFEALLPSVQIEFLASALGCKDVLRDFWDVAKIVEDSSRQVQSDTQAAVHLYDHGRGSQYGVSPDHSVPTHDVQSALRLYGQSRLASSVSANPHEVLGDKGKTLIQRALQLYVRGRGYNRLGCLEKDFAALYISRTFRLLVQTFRQNAGKKKASKRKLEALTTPEEEHDDGEEGFPAGKRGHGAETRAYNRILQACGPDAETGTLRNIKRANYWGLRLHNFDVICGSGYPLWMLRPTRKISCPLNAEYKFKPSM
jgi:hypothetical protein